MLFSNPFFEKPNDGKFFCDECKKSYHSSTNLKRHIIAIHEKLRPYSCKYCEKTFNDAGAVRRHQAIHEAKGERKFACSVCKKTYTTESYRRWHMKIAHLEDYYNCPKCPSKIKGKGHFNEHLKVHSTNLNCPHCNKTFHRPTLLNKHVTLMHTKQERISCGNCDSTFKGKDYLRKHMKYRHSDNDKEKWKCPFCEKCFSQQGPLIVHKRTHDVSQKKTCTICHEKFSNNYTLKVHTINRHDSAVLTCHISGLNFSSKSAKDRHDKIHKPVEPTYRCPKCSKAFFESSNIAGHRRVCCPTGEDVDSKTRYPCKICPSKFRFESELNMHMKKMHHQDKAGFMRCSKCDYQTRYKAHIKNHRAFHD